MQSISSLYVIVVYIHIVQKIKLLIKASPRIKTYVLYLLQCHLITYKVLNNDIYNVNSTLFYMTFDYVQMFSSINNVTFFPRLTLNRDLFCRTIKAVFVEIVYLLSSAVLYWNSVIKTNFFTTIFLISAQKPAVLFISMHILQL